MRELLPAIHDPNVKLEPGRPGRGYDPTAGFTDLQWYLYHNRDIAYFAAFSSRDYSEKAALEAARMLAGATLPGVNGCVAVSGRDLVTLNFAMEKPLLPNLSRLDPLP